METQQRQRRWDTFFSTLANSGVTGLSRVGSESSRTLKLFWFLLFVFGAVGFSVNFYLILRQFQREPILTQINYEHSDFTWPHITLCYPASLIPFWKRPSLQPLWKSYLRNATRIQRRSWKYYLEREILTMASVDPNKFFKDRYLPSILSFRSQNQVIEEMGMKSYESYKPIPDWHSGFHGYFYTKEFPFPCYTLKPELLSKVSKLKMSQVKGLRMFLFLDFESYEFFNSLQDNVLDLYITNPNHTITASEVHSIIPGTESHFQITESKFRGLKNCTDRDHVVDIYDNLLHKTHRYTGSHEDCRFRLSQRLYYKHCGCYNSFFPIYKENDFEPRFCLNMTLYNATEIISNYRCLEKVRDKYKDSENRRKRFRRLVNKECGDFVKPKCTRSIYSISRKTFTKPRKINSERRSLLTKFAQTLSHKYSKNVENSVKRNRTETFIIDNFAHIYFHRNNKKVSLTHEEWEYTIPKFLSDVGGLLGLWLGLSVIGIIELWDLIIRLCVSAITTLINRLHQKL